MGNKKHVTIHRQDWWATPIWFFDIDETSIDFNQAIKECYKEKDIDKEGRKRSNINGWQSDIIPFDKYKEIQKIIQLIVTSSITYKNILGILDDLQLIIQDYWININDRRGYNMPHVHPGSILSGVLYLKAPQTCGDIKFFRNHTDQYALGDFTKNNNAYNFETISYVPQEKRVLVFPSHIVHSVDENKSDKDRISIAFNFVLK